MPNGQINIIENFFMPELKRDRNIRIYTPPNYDKNKKYPVLYMHDAQNLFDVKTSSFGMSWDVSKTIDNLCNQKNIDGIIVVGIDNHPKMRLTEYSPWENLEMAKLISRDYYGGEGFEYIDFIVNTLKPFIDNNYSTLPDKNHTYIGGSSMGGFISIIAGLKYQNVFSKVLAFSSAIFFAPEKINNFIKNSTLKEDLKIYMDIGTNETSNKDLKEFPQIYIDTNREAIKSLESIGFDNSNLIFNIIEDAQHNELAWAKRFPDALNWLLK